MEETFDKFKSRSSLSRKSRAKTKLGPGQWWLALKRTKEEVSRDNLSIVSAGVAFFVFLGVFPLMAAMISLYGVFSSPEDIVSVMESFKTIIPSDILSVMENQLTRLVASSEIASRAALISLLAALWSGSKAVKGMMNALSIVNGKRDERHFVVKTLIALLLTLGGVLFGVVCAFLLAILPALAAYFNLAGPALYLLEAARWSLLGLAVASALGTLYRFGPDRRGKRWKWLTPGSLVATFIWLLVSGLFSWFVANFGNYNKTYGSLGAIAILLLWLFLSAFVFILGAELDAELEREKRGDHVNIT